MEATEMPEFSKKMKESGEESLTHISLAISIIAVLVAMVTVLGHRSHTQAVLFQERTGNAWNYYEAKRNREDNLQLDLDLLQLQPKEDSAATEAKLSEYKAKLNKWSGELKEEQATAEEFQHKSELAEGRADRFDLGEALLQIAVVLSSITLLTRGRSYFVAGLLLGAAGMFVATSAWLVH
jgi:Domain of unknown function (DUF4337)